MADNKYDNIQPISAAEYAMVGAALFERLSTVCGNYTPDYQGLHGNGHIGLFTVPGGHYIATDVTGGYTARLPVQLVLQVATADANRALLRAETDLIQIAAALATKPYPELDDDRIIDNILIDGIPYRSQTDDSGAVVFTMTGAVIYSK